MSRWLELPIQLNEEVIRKGIFTLDISISYYIRNDYYNPYGDERFYHHPILTIAYLEQFKNGKVTGTFHEFRSGEVLRFEEPLGCEDFLIFEYNIMEKKMYYYCSEDFSLRSYKLEKIRI